MVVILDTLAMYDQFRATADADDVERAARRAALLRKADLPAVGLVACAAIPPQTLAHAREQGVRAGPTAGCWKSGRQAHRPTRLPAS